MFAILLCVPNADFRMYAKNIHPQFLEGNQDKMTVNELLAKMLTLYTQLVGNGEWDAKATNQDKDFVDI